MNDRRLSKGDTEKLRLHLGCSSEAVAKIPEPRLAKALQKLEIPNRPRARVEHEQSILRDDKGEIPENGRTRALQQLNTFRASCKSVSGLVAGIPVGTTVLPVGARRDRPVAGLTANTGWTTLGPGNVGGRTRAILIDPNDSSRLYAAGVGGGVWLSTDSGSSWTPTDDLMANLAVCSLVMDPTDSSIIFAGTGEGFSNIDAVRGDGIFRTDDGGVTWNQLPATAANANFFYVNSLAISADGQTLLAGTNTGIFRSTDSGQTWNRVHTVAIGNLAVDPGNSANAIAGGLDNGRAYFSTDGGVTWQQATAATGNGARVQVCYAAADTATVYASVQANPSEFWRSTDGGQTYASRNAASGGAPANFLGGQGWYDNAVWAGDPTDVNLVLVGGIDLWRSTDGGDTLTPISTWWSDQSAHADHHAIVPDPNYDGVNNRRVYFGNDGGVYRTDDVTTVGNNPGEPFTNGWVDLNNGYGVTQFYYGAGHIGTGTIMGGTQDNGTRRYTPAQGVQIWNEVWGGDGGDVASDPADSQIWYGEYVYLQIFRDTSGGTSANLATDYICGRYYDNGWGWKPAPFTITDARNQEAQFIAPFELDPNNPERLLGGAMSLWRTDDARTPNSINPPAGPSWAAIKARIGPSAWSHSITAIAIAHGNSDIVVVGHANGDIYRSSDATSASPNWQQIDTNGINANRRCLSLRIDPDDHDIVYASFGGYQSGNLWRTTDGGQSWADLSAGLPDAPVRDVALHPQRSSWVYAATEVGLFASEDSGATWSPANEGPANVACSDLFWQGCRLICVTHGRGMFEIGLPIPNAFPAPVLEFTGTESFTVSGNAFTRYKLSVTNHASYPDSLFRPSPDLPPCGANASASRTWVDIFNGDTNQRMYGFCALTASQDLTAIWFALPQGDPAPGSVYVVLRDRRCPSSYTSNAVPVGAPVPAHCEVTNVVIVNDRIEVQGRATGCSPGASVDIEGPEGNARVIRSVGHLDSAGRFDVNYRGSEVAAGRWRAIIRNADGSECCRSAFVQAIVRKGRRKSPWGS